MPTADVVEPDEYQDDELPSKFLVFACPDLDQNEDKAREASDEIQDILCDLVDNVWDLEDIERALREPKPPVVEPGAPASNCFALSAGPTVWSPG
jgi:hypothetical protein